MLSLPTSRIHKRFGFRLALLVLALLAGACSSDSPTEPVQNPGPPPGGGGATAWNITVTSGTPEVTVNSQDAVTVTVRVRRADNGQPPPDGTTVQVSTTLGDLNAPDSGVQSGIVQLSGGNATVLFFPGGTNGTAIVRAQLENSVGSTQIRIVGSETFFLAAVSPNSGDGSGGEVVRITGGGFYGPVRVLFGGTAGEVLEVTESLIRVRTPNVGLQPGQSQTVSVSVTVGFNTEDALTDTLPNVFTFGEDPTIEMQVFSVSPNAGPNEGGTRITITGQGFSSPIQVLFGGGSTTAFTGVEAVVRSVTSSQIVVDSPAATGFGVDNRDAEVAVLVRNTDTGESALLGSAFQYGNEIFITAVSPNIGPAAGGQLVTFFGQGFDEPVAVTIGGVAATPISVTGSEVIARTSAIQLPADCSEDIVGDTGITNIETGASASGPSYTYEITDLAPIVTSISPTNVSQSGGETITLTGANFNAPVQLVIDGGLVTPTSVSSTQIRFDLPAFDSDDLDTEACDDNSDGTEGERFLTTVVQRSIEVNISGGCSLTDPVAANFTVTPSDTSCRNDVGPPPPPPDPPAAPVASFDVTINGMTASFDNTSVNATAFVWNFGDGTTSNAPDPQHTYAASGTYTVRLTATGPGGSDTETQNVTIP